MSASEHLQTLLANLPTRPGCYLMKNAAGEIIYVGKAINLRQRVRSYFHESGQTPKTRRMVREIADIEWIVVETELEALLLEMNLIKKHRPKYNVRLKDDKRYPYIKVHWADPFPKVTVTRQLVNDGSRYFGPYASAWAVHQTLDVLRRIFPYLTCDRPITGQDARPCLYYDIKLCAGPCIGAIDQAGYRQMIADLMNFLNGRGEEIIERLQKEMEQAAEALRFEKAARLRDQIQALQAVIEKQKITFGQDMADSDILAMARSDGEACVQVFFIRGGKLIGREYFVLENTAESEDAEILAQFLKQFYAEVPNIPEQLMLPQEIEEAQIISQWLRTRRGGEKVEIVVPRQGQAHELLKMALENAQETLNILKARWQADTHRQEEALTELQQALSLPHPPNRIECYDISNTQGMAIVGAMVVFEQGVPNKSLYRRFNIESVRGMPDDFASMEEMLRRRFRRWQVSQETAAQPGEKVDRAFAILPDLIVIDGGKGQLARAVKVLQEFSLYGQIPLIALAKQQEEIFFPERTESLLLPRTSPALYLLQRVRDEAHRFGLTAHRQRRKKLGMASQLEAIPGIGPTRRKALLRHFGSIEAIRQASIEELASVPGMTRAAAEQLKAHLE
ncbi:MAG: excinuclease ABC subunit UvrC [Chloroflexi bacterium]|jgi:excinuclease ABC subunit C|nr:excinuclease ABC subunit UvrC [Chloroflexota bacterium]